MSLRGQGVEGYDLKVVFKYKVTWGRIVMVNLDVNLKAF